MEKAITTTQLVLSILIILLVLMQQRGTALGGAFGGSGNVYRTRRGAEKFLFRLTVVLVVIFIILAISDLII